MNAVNPTLRTRYYKELTRRRKRLNGADDESDADIVDDADADRFDDQDPETAQDGVRPTSARASDDVDTLTVLPSGGGGVNGPLSLNADHPSASVGRVTTEKTMGAYFAPPSTFAAPHRGAMGEDSFDDSMAGAGIDGSGVFLPGDGFGAMELDGVGEGGTGTKMYTPAQKKAIVEYAVQYGERAAAKKFGVHRKNIYR